MIEQGGTGRVMRPSAIGGGLVFVLLLLLGLKTCIVTVWAPDKTTVRYAVVGGDGRTLEIYLFPDRRAIFWYTDPSLGVVDGSLAYLRGSVGTHYVGQLWHIGWPRDQIRLAAVSRKVRAGDDGSRDHRCNASRSGRFVAAAAQAPHLLTICLLRGSRPVSEHGPSNSAARS